MKRSTLKKIIREACKKAGTAPKDTRRLVASANNIDKVAVGHFNYYEKSKNALEPIVCGCPAKNAGYWDEKNQTWEVDTSKAVQRFPEEFDRLWNNNTVRGKKFLKGQAHRDFGNGYVEIED